MQIEFIDITSFRGLSSEAEHFYASIGVPSLTQEMLLTDRDCRPSAGVSFINTEKLRYFPSAEEACAMWEKDNRFDRNPFVQQHKEDAILDLQENGTARFPTVEAVIKAARKKFPDSYLSFSFNGSVKEFIRIFVLPEKTNKALDDEIVDLIHQNDKK